MENKIIGSKIAEARKKINISQAQLAQKLFISSQAVGKWERGESFPDIITFERLAHILGVDLNYFSKTFVTSSNEIITETKTNNHSEKPINEKKKSNTLWDMSNGNWVDADFSGLKNLQEKFSSSNCKNCQFINSNLSGLILKSNNVENCDFSNADIKESQLLNSNLSHNSYKKCLMNETIMSGSSISGCDFSDSDLTEVVIKSSAFSKNIMDNAVLKGTSFHSTHLSDIVFNSDIEDCQFENCNFLRVTFENLTIKNTFFKCKNLKKIKLVACKVDSLTYAFLKNGKADMNGVTLLSE